jgi:hypothetical protein
MRQTMRQKLNLITLKVNNFEKALNSYKKSLGSDIVMTTAQLLSPKRPANTFYNVPRNTAIGIEPGIENGNAHSGNIY